MGNVGFSYENCPLCVLRDKRIAALESALATAMGEVRAARGQKVYVGNEWCRARTATDANPLCAELLREKA